MVRVEVVSNGKVIGGAKTKEGLARAIRKAPPTPKVRGTAESLVALGAYVPEGGSAIHDVMLEWAPGRFVVCVVITGKVEPKAEQQAKPPTIHQAEIIRSEAHRLLDAEMEARVAFHADCGRKGKYDHDSPNLNRVIRLNSAVEALANTFGAVVNGKDAATTLQKHISREMEPSARAVSASEYLAEVLTKVETAKVRGDVAP